MTWVYMQERLHTLQILAQCTLGDEMRIGLCMRLVFHLKSSKAPT